MSNIAYTVKIDGITHRLVYISESKGKYVYQIENSLIAPAHWFNEPLAKFPKDMPVRHNGHVYEVISKP